MIRYVHRRLKKRLALGILKTSTITRHIDVGIRLATGCRPTDVVKTSRAGHLKDVVKLSVKQTLVTSWLPDVIQPMHQSMVECLEEVFSFQRRLDLGKHDCRDKVDSCFNAKPDAKHRCFL